jgi:hypothetical protein
MLDARAINCLAGSNANSEIWNNYGLFIDSPFAWLTALKFFFERRKSELFIENFRFVTHFALHVAACWNPAA